MLEFGAKQSVFPGLNLRGAIRLKFQTQPFDIKLTFLAIFLTSNLAVSAGVRREIESAYVQKYENKAIFLRVPVRGLQQVVFVTAAGPSLNRGNVTESLMFRVGDQVRITEVKFGADYVRFKIASIDLRRASEVVFRFPSRLQENSIQKDSLDRALEYSFTEGLHYAELDSAKEQFVLDEFEKMLQLFARASGSSTDFVRKTISEKNPDYLAVKKEATGLRQKLANVEEELQRQGKARAGLESKLSGLREKLTQSDSRLDSAKMDSRRLSEQNDSLNRQLRQLQETNREYEHRVDELIRTLDVKTTSNADLGKRVEALSTAIQLLREERASLSQKLDQVSEELETFRKKNRQLEAKLRRARQKNTRLSKDLRALTSNRESLEARYLETKKRKEALENADALAQAMRLDKSMEERAEGTYQVANLYLLSQRVGTFEVRVPKHPGEACPVQFSAESPDTVQFTEEERTLYEGLGEKLQIETAWSTTSDRLHAELVEKEALQSLAPREKVQWPWRLEGELARPERVLLHIDLISADGEKISLPAQEFVVEPGGMVGQLRQHWSLPSLLAGSLSGIFLFGLLFGFRRRSRSQFSPPSPSSSRSSDYGAPKRL